MHNDQPHHTRAIAEELARRQASVLLHGVKGRFYEDRRNVFLELPPLPAKALEARHDGALLVEIESGHRVWTRRYTATEAAQ